MVARLTRAHKHLRLDAVKTECARSETEAVERSLDLVISELERNWMVAKANERFVTSGIVIKDVYGTLEE